MPNDVSKLCQFEEVASNGIPTLFLENEMILAIWLNIGTQRSSITLSKFINFAEHAASKSGRLFPMHFVDD